MSRRAWLAFAAMSTIWGVPYLFIKIAVDGGAPPALVAWGRVTLAAVVLLVARPSAPARSLAARRAAAGSPPTGSSRSPIAVPADRLRRAADPSSMAAIMIA